MSYQIIVDDLWYTYPGQTEPALKNIDLKIGEGDFVSIAGPTGCGKSTLVLCMTGIIPHVLEGEMKGKVVIDGKDTRSFEVCQLAQSVGLVLQDAESQLCSLIVEDEVAFGPENLAKQKEEIEKLVNFALDATGMYDLRHKYVFNLSMGQKQRTVIASSLSMLPKILVLDEPLSELDPVGTMEVLQTLRRLNEEFGVTIILIEHKLEKVLEFAKRIILFNQGKIVADGEPHKVFEGKKPADWLGLRVPEPLKLSYKLIEKGLMTKTALSIQEFETLMPELQIPKHTQPDYFSASGKKRYPLYNELVRTEGLFYTYDDGTVALKNINLRIFQGEFIAILGSNGTGKTTLAFLMTGLLRPTKGKVYIEGKDSAKLGVANIAGVVGYTFQNPDCQLVCKTVGEEIAFGPKQLGLPKKEIDNRVKEALHVMGIEQFKNQYPHALSRGERLRVAVASVLAIKPKILLLDEPTMGQDSKQIKSLMAHLQSLNRQGLTVIIITHDINIAAKHVRRAIVLNSGKIVADGDSYEVFSKEDLLRSSSLEPPAAICLSSLVGVKPMLTVNEISKAILSAASDHAIG